MADTSIYEPMIRANAGRTVEDAYADILKARAAGQQVQLNSARIQQERLENQQKQQALRDQAALGQLYVKHGGNLDKVIEEAPGAGVGWESIEAIRGHNDQSKTRAATLKREELLTQNEHADKLLGYLDPVESALPTQQPEVYKNQLNAAIKSGLVKPGELPEEFPGLQALSMWRAGLLGHKGYLTEAQKKYEAESRDMQTTNAALGIAAKLPKPQAIQRVPGPTTPLTMAPGETPGLVKPGNVDLRRLNVIDNGDGSYSTVNSVSFTDERPGSPTEGKEILVRGILDGKRVDPGDPKVMESLRNQYYSTGQNLGVFDTPENATAYAQRLHSDWEEGKIPGTQFAPSAAKKYEQWRGSLPESARKLAPEQAPEDVDAFMERFGTTPADQSLIDQRTEQAEDRKETKFQKSVVDASAALAATANAVQYGRVYDKLPKDVQAKFPDPEKIEKFDKEFLQKLRFIGMNPAQQEAAQERLDRDAAKADEKGKPKEATPAQLNAIEARKNAAIRSARNAYQNSRIHTDEDLQKLRALHQEAQNNYENELRRFGYNIDHFEYAPISEWDKKGFPKQGAVATPSKSGGESKPVDVTVQDPQGRSMTFTFPTQEAADKFEAARARLQK